MTVDDIEYGDSEKYGRTYYQPIMIGGEEVAVLVMKEPGNSLAEIEEFIQCVVPEEVSQYAPSHYNSEDAGFVFVKFPDDESFVEFYNKFYNQTTHEYSVDNFEDPNQLKMDFVTESEDDRMNIEYAVNAYSFVLPRNKEYTISEFIEKIKQSYDMNSRRGNAILRSLDRISKKYKLKVDRSGSVEMVDFEDPNQLKMNFDNNVAK